MKLLQECEHHEENSTAGNQLFANVGESENKFLGEKHERHQQPQVPEDAHHRL